MTLRHPPGVRVSLRRRLAEGGYGDVLGHVLKWDDTVVVLQKADGVVVSVDPATIVAARKIPPAPERRQR